MKRNLHQSKLWLFVCCHFDRQLIVFNEQERGWRWQVGKRGEVAMKKLSNCRHPLPYIPSSVGEELTMSQRNVCTECCVRKVQTQAGKSIVEIQGITKITNKYLFCKAK